MERGSNLKCNIKERMTEEWKPRPRATYRRQNMCEEIPFLQAQEKAGAV